MKTNKKIRDIQKKDRITEKTKNSANKKQTTAYLYFLRVQKNTRQKKKSDRPGTKNRMKNSQAAHLFILFLPMGLGREFKQPFLHFPPLFSGLSMNDWQVSLGLPN